MSTLEPITQELKIHVFFVCSKVFLKIKNKMFDNKMTAAVFLFMFSRNNQVHVQIFSVLFQLSCCSPPCHGFPLRANPPASLILHPRFGYQPIHKGLLLTSDKELLEASPEKSLDHINVYI